MPVGQNIRKRRELLKMTQCELAAAVGISQPAVAQIERGTKSVSLQLSVEIARVLQCDLNDLVQE